MTETDADLDDAFEEGTTVAERVHDDADGDSLPDEHRETLRESTERLAAAVSEASLEELLDAAGFDDVPDEVSPVDLPTVIRDADAAAIMQLRTLLQLADLGESWSDLSDEERIERVDRVVGDESDGEGGFAQLKEYLDQFGHVGGDGDDASTDDEDNGEAADAADSSAEADDAAEETDGDDESDEDDDLLELEDHLNRLKQLVGDDGRDEAETAEADAEAETAETDAEPEAAEADAVDEAESADEEDEDDESDGRRVGRSRTGSSRFSTVPSSRSDTGTGLRFSTIRARK